MTEAIRIIRELTQATPTERRRALKPFVNEKDIAEIYQAMREDLEKRSYVRALCDMAAAPAAAEIIKKSVLPDKEGFLEILNAKDAKLRKNSVELIGRVAPKEFADEMLDMLINEEIYFVIPSILLSLGNTESEEVLNFLKAYKYPKMEEPKHARDCRDALEKAISSLSQNVESVWPVISAEDMILLDCPSAAVTVRELSGLKIRSVPAKGLSNCVFVKGVTDFKNLYKARTFYDASVYYKKCYDSNEAGEILASKDFADFCKSVFGEDLRVRVDVRGFMESEKREAAVYFTRKLSRENGFVNSPSSYNFLVRIMAAKNEIHVMLTASPRLDMRFAYKVANVPASINPAAAASVVLFAKPYTKRNAVIADPFCGSGTMLFERAKFGYASLLGMDISEDAIKASNANEKNARTGAHFIRKDATKPYREKFDEIISNMPFGLRVSSHENNEYLYTKFMNNLVTALKEDGVAILFTNDKKQLSAVIPSEFKVVERHTFSCGGLSPDCFIIKHRE